VKRISGILVNILRVLMVTGNAPSAPLHSIVYNPRSRDHEVGNGAGSSTFSIKRDGVRILAWKYLTFADLAANSHSGSNIGTAFFRDY
jgi:hypothetical protein